MEHYINFKKAGVIHKIVQNQLKEILKEGISALEITEFIEDEIKKFTKYEPETHWVKGLGFPVGININDVAAHFTPSIECNPIIKENDLVKIDFGVHVQGCISDGAFSWCPSGKHNKLAEIAEEATMIGIKNSGDDACLGDIGNEIEETIESHEIVIDNKIFPVKSISDLSGHSIKPYQIHGGKMVPNGKFNYKERMKEGEVFAIETFPTTGNKKIQEISTVNHFALEQETENNAHLYKKFKTLPFCERWINTGSIGKDVIKYPVLMNDGIVAQFEKSIFIKSNSVEILN